MPTVVQQRKVPEAVRSAANMDRSDYVDFFTVSTSAAAARSPEQWARVGLDEAAGSKGQFVWRVLCGLRLEQRPDYVAGWKIGDSGDGWIRVQAVSWFMTAHLVVYVDDGQISVGTFIRYDPTGRCAHLASDFRRPSSSDARPLATRRQDRGARAVRADATAVRGTAGRHGGAAFAVSRTYLWVWGAMMVVLGVGSLMVNPNFGTGQDVTVGHLFGVFEVNGWHALAGLVSGIIALAFALSRRWVVLGAVYIALTSGLVPGGLFLASGDGSTAFDLIPVDYWDAITLHLVPGVIGIACVLADLVLQQRSTADLASASETRL